MSTNPDTSGNGESIAQKGAEDATRAANDEQPTDQQDPGQEESTAENPVISPSPSE